jgi:predicted  nucleic acid-binding Zn-ribbon protein
MSKTKKMSVAKQLTLQAALDGALRDIDALISANKELTDANKELTDANKELSAANKDLLRQCNGLSQQRDELGNDVRSLSRQFDLACTRIGRMVVLFDLSVVRRKPNNANMLRCFSSDSDQFGLAS